MSKKITRREFVETSAKTVAAGALLVSGVANAAKTAPRSKVAEVTAKAVNKGRKIDAKKVRQMVKKGMAALTGEKEPFKKLFSAKDKVGLKINCLGRPRIYTHHEVIDAFAEELKAAGVKPENIVVWDRFEEHMTDCGFKMNPKGPGVLVRATESYRGDNDCLDDTDPYVCKKDQPSGRQDDGSTASRLSRIFTRDCNKHINLAILKDHGLSGVTLCLKNIAYGVCDNNRRFHGPAHINPFISGFCAKKSVMDKFTLHVIDGLEGCYDDGPCPGSEDPIFAHNTIWFSRDPVALDALGTAVIEARRKKQGLRSLKKSGRHPDHIEMASKLGLGNFDPAKMNIEKIAL